MLTMVREVTDATFASDVLEARGLVLVEFGADWCPPCRAIAPVLEEIARDKAGVLAVRKLDVDRSPRAAERYGALSLPTLILLRDGEPVERLVGARPKSALLRALEPHLPRG
jgi:thioredoxin 1